MDLRDLAQIQLTTKEVQSLLELPPPESSKITGTCKQLVLAVDNLFDLWREILVSGKPIPLEIFAYKCPEGHKIKITGEDLRGRLLLVVACYFDYLLRLWLEKSKSCKGKDYPVTLLSMDAAQSFLPKHIDSKYDFRISAFRMFSSQYFFALFSLHFISLFRHTSLPQPFVFRFEAFAHETLLALFNSATQIPGDNEKAAANRLIGGALELAKTVYGDAPKLNKEHKTGPFSTIKLDELSMLARRDDSMLSRYGHKYVERRFESQLALILQSFGLYVVSTRIGHSTVDLVCISSSSEKPLTFLLEAKTTASPYTLPKKDFRALRDYVSDVKRSLSTLPPLSFVLVTGCEASKTLSAKLTYLENEASIPIRFIRAQQIAEIRERITGPLPVKMFAHLVLAGDKVLSKNFADQLVSCYEAEHKAHTTFVESMLTARGVTKPCLEWTQHHPKCKRDT